MSLSRRHFLHASAASMALPLLPAGLLSARASVPLLSVTSRTLEVKGKAAKVFGITGPNGRPGIFANEGDRFFGAVRNGTDDPLTMHWHGQVFAPEDQDRARPDGGTLAVGADDSHDFLLTPGTHWMHAHQFTEQQLLAAPMITREKDAGDVQDVVVMLHDFAFRSPTEILAELGGVDAHKGHGGHEDRRAGAQGGHGMHHMPGMGQAKMGQANMGQANMGHMMPVHANDVKYDAYLANDRTLDDPEVVRVAPGAKVRLRIINGATATAFFIGTGALEASVIAVDGSPCQPLARRSIPLAQGQRVDLLVSIPAAGGAFPILAQVEADRRRTGIVLATEGATVSKVAELADVAAPLTSLEMDAALRAAHPLPDKRPDRSFMLLLGEEAGYRWTINGRTHGEHQPLEARKGERIALTFMNPTMMMHPMHIHGHHFQVVGSRAGHFAGPRRDVVIVPPHTPITVVLDADKVGRWFLHCHHLYHMATGMMTELKVS